MRVHQNLEIAQVQKSVNKVEKTAVTVIVKLRKQLSADIAALRQQMAALPKAEGLEDSLDIQRQLLSLGESVASLQEIVASAVLDVRAAGERTSARFIGWPIGDISKLWNRL